jgi:hypothetical protein
MAMGTYPVNLTDGFAAIGDNAALSIYNIGSDRPTIRPTLRNQLAPVMDRHSILGGRHGELSDLFGWMERRRSGYTFVTGPSGYGKTALLVHFVRSLQARGEDPVYHFVSRRDDMLSQADFSFRSLCQQLIARHGYGGELPSSTAEVRGLYSALLRIPPPPGRRIVVVLDGLDEASDWSAGPQLFPAQLPSGVHVVFSAREVADRNWLDQLGLDGRVDFLRLEALDIAGVRDVLAAAGTESLTQAALSNAFVQAVHEVSGGDPFYLRFLVEDLAVSPDLPERAVRRKPKGLDAYLNLWWLDVAAKATAPAVADVLGYLAVATGRLTRAELADISDEDKLSGFTIDPAIEAVERYLIGTGGAGYTMSHPRFTDYVVNNRLRPEDLRHYREALLKWCLSWQGKGWPAGTPAYPLQHIVAHLIQDEEQAAHVYAVLDAPYMKAKLARFGSFRSLLDDLRSGVSAAMSAPRADVLFRLALMHNAIQDGVAALPLDELAPLYVRAGDLDRALDLAAAVRPLWLRGRTMIVIAGALLPNSWAEAVGVADRIELPGYRAEALFDVAAALLADDAKAPDADAILKRIDEIDLQDESAVWVAARLTKLAGASRRRDPARSEQFIERAVAAAHAADGQQRAMAFEAIGRSVAATDPDRACSFYRASLEALADMGLNEWQAKRARDTIKALADCDIAAAVGAAEAVSNDLIRPYVFAGLAEQADDPADACQWVERAMAAIPAIRRLYKTEAKRWAANARAAAAVGLAHHDLPGALALLREEPYYYRDAALKRMASVSAQKRDNVLVIADAASGPDVRDEVLATFIRREIVKDPHVIRDLIPLVTDPITTAALMVEATETPDDSQQDKKPILDLARPAALRVVHERPDLLARLAAVFDAYRRDSGRPLLALAAKSAQTAADGRISSGSPVLTVIRSCVDQGDTDSAMALLRQITRSLVAVDSETALQVRAMLVEAVARSDEAAAARLVQAGPDEDRAPLKAAIAKGVASSNPGRGAKLVSALPESEVPRDPAEDVRCQALGTLVESSAAAGPGGVKSRAAKLRKCHGESGWLDYKCDIHARASAAVARHDPELAEQLLRWVATKRYGDTALVAKALVALALVDNARGTSLAADVIEKYVQDGRGNQEDLAVLSSAVARFAPQDALAFLELRRLHQAGYRGQVLGWAAASMARTDAADAQQLLEHAVADVEQAESLWLRVDGLREVATATSTWDPARARALLERCIAWAREGTAVTTLAEQLARAANALIDVADMSAAAPWIEEALFLLRAEPAGAIRLDVLEAILAIQEKCPPGIAYPLLVHTVEAVLDGSPMMGEELLTLLRACLTVGQQDEPSAACELFSAFHAAVRSVEMIFAG